MQETPDQAAPSRDGFMARFAGVAFDRPQASVGHYQISQNVDTPLPFQ